MTPSESFAVLRFADVHLNVPLEAFLAVFVAGLGFLALVGVTADFRRRR